MSSFHHQLRTAGNSHEWVVVGRTKSVTKSTATTVNVSLTGLTEGIQSSPSKGDLVLVFVMYPRTSTLNITTSGFTSTTQITGSGSSVQVLSSRFAHKVMGDTPDSQITITRTGANSTYGMVVLVEVVRGADITTPLDVDVVTSHSAGWGANPNPGPITPVTAGSRIYAFCASYAGRTDRPYTTSYAYNYYSIDNDIAEYTMFGYVDWLGGTLDLPSLGGGYAGYTSDYASVAYTIALRPA